MGALIAAIPAIAGAAGTAGTVMTVASVAGTALSGLASIRQGQAASDAADFQSRQIALQGRLDAIQTNEELLKTLSRNKVAAYAGGLETAGSVEYAKQQSMANAAEQLNINRMNVESRQRQVEQAGSAAKQQSIFDAVGAGISAGDIVGSALQTKRRTK